MSFKGIFELHHPQDVRRGYPNLLECKMQMVRCASCDGCSQKHAHMYISNVTIDKNAPKKISKHVLQYNMFKPLDNFDLILWDNDKFFFKAAITYVNEKKVDHVNIVSPSSFLCEDEKATRNFSHDFIISILYELNWLIQHSQHDDCVSFFSIYFKWKKNKRFVKSFSAPNLPSALTFPRI